MTDDQDPFQVVLIDIKKAAEEDIQCVKKPLTDPLDYVAISYRWGELEEAIVDTQVGYLASITSFDLNSFYVLCRTLSGEPTTASIPYVWVDAICVNQTDHDERKSTIYHMSDIYEQARWILAVPDLHSAHLRMMHADVMNSLWLVNHYVYHLLHGHTETLHEMDHAFLDDIGVPQDPDLRHLLVTYTDSFADSFMTPATFNYAYNHIHTIEYLYNLSKNSGTAVRSLQNPMGLHQCEVDCPLDYFHDLYKPPPPLDYKSGEWGRLILERRTTIQHAMHFLTALVVDWSSRVWVISEFHISKKKNNLKFWFNQLSGHDIAFFTFDIHDPHFKRIQNTKLSKSGYGRISQPVYITFYQRLIHQLNRQSFLEMILKSKASKNEDRFYAIFPFFPEYKHLLQNEALDKMNSMIDVKLKLYQVMTNEHKLLLLHLSSKGTTTLALPTFATSAIDWLEPDHHQAVDITLCQSPVGHYLRVKPTNYVMKRDVICIDATSKTLNRLLWPKTLRQEGDWYVMQVVRMYGTEPTSIVLIGSFVENIWILAQEEYHFTGLETVQDLADDFPGFHVY